jgi:GNAT superfamily N-acetyltransferase
MSFEVQQLGEDSAADVVDVVHDAFFDYPVMRFVIGPDSARYSEHLRRFVNFIVMARIHRDEVMFGVADEGALQGVALVSVPSRVVVSPSLDAVRDELWAELGADARARYEAYNAIASPFMPRENHYHLNVLAVRHAAHGKGYARPLLERVHALSADDPGSSGVSLTTELEKNVSLYEYFGYRVVGRAEFAPGLTCWGFFRPDEP